MDIALPVILPLLIGSILDLLIGDPPRLPHPVIGFGKIISWGEKRLNTGTNKKLKGALFSILLITGIFVISHLIINGLTEVSILLAIIFSSIMVFYCLAAKTLISEVREVFLAVDRSVEEGRMQVARIVGRDTSQLDVQQIRTAALETLAENLSDGVIAPLFWYAVLGVPGMLAYKMVNTLDSMIGYKNERYKQFGCWAAYIDDIANYIPARITAALMVIVTGKWRVFKFINKYGRKHASPNSGYPESALAGILDCRFGGPNVYFGHIVEKPYIGTNPRLLTTDDMKKAIAVNFRSGMVMVIIVAILQAILYRVIYL